MRVLLHNSHHQEGRPNGWSGAPGEADWVMDLNSRIARGLQDRGVECVRADGDLEDHPEFLRNYDAFVAPHYEADVHDGHGGCFWGRAAGSYTSERDDVLGKIFWAKFRRINGCPPERFDWSNPNVTDYYGFRLTGKTTPGVLVEHGVGWGANKAWLRDKIGDIANAWVDTLCEFGGVGSQEEDVALTDADKQWILDNVAKPLADKLNSGFNTTVSTLLDRQSRGDMKVATEPIDEVA